MTQQSPDPSSRANRWVLAGLAAAFVLILAYLLRWVLLPFLAAAGLAYVSTPSVDWLAARFRVPRWAAAMAPFFIFLGMLAAGGCALRLYVVPDVITLLTDREQILERFLNIVFQGKPIPIGGGKSYSAHDAAGAILDSAASILPRSEMIPAIGAAFAAIMSVILTIVLFLYFLFDGPRIGRGLFWLVPPVLRPQAAAVGRRAGPMIFSYVRGILVITAYATIFSWLILRFALHVPHAIVLALAVGILEMVPLIGPILSIVMICLVAVEQLTLWNIIGLAIFVTALRVSIDQFVGPVVLGKAVRLPPPVIMFSFMAGGVIWGLMGVALAIPVAAIIKIVLEEAYGPDNRT